MITSVVWRIASIFFGFTFDTPADFGPILTLAIGMAAVVWYRFKGGPKVCAPLGAAVLLLALWPLLPNIGLLFLAREFQSINGFWPRVMIDDPKNQAGLSPQYDALHALVSYLNAFSGAWFILFIALFFVARPRLSQTQTRLTLGTAGAALLIAMIDPGNLYAWWMD